METIIIGAMLLLGFAWVTTFAVILSYMSFATAYVAVDTFLVLYKSDEKVTLKRTLAQAQDSFMSMTAMFAKFSE
jgi:hypothetical protein